MINPVIRKYGSNAILMEWQSEISPKINQEVVRTAKYLEKKYANSILEIVPSYCSLLIFLKKGRNVQEHIALLRYQNIPILENSDFSPQTTWEIPVCYNTTFGFDLSEMSTTLNCSVDEIIQLHTESTYRIYGMGFLPGFLYLGGLNEQLHTPRKGKITQFIPKGSVAIGGEQTGIYPQNSPGGWHVLGRTPINLFDVKNDPPTPFSAGDFIQFSPIDLEEFEKIQHEVIKGHFQLKPMNDD